MAATGLEVFDRTLHTTNAWLDQLMETVGPDRHLAWHTLGAVLRGLRDRLPIAVSAHLGAQLPLLVRGAFYEQFQPARQPTAWRTEEEFLAHVEENLAGTRPIDARAASRAVMAVLNHHVTPEQVEKVKRALPERIRELWPAAGETP
jgi:uncharacterized protein (DUF2267 family)